MSDESAAMHETWWWRWRETGDAAYLDRLCRSMEPWVKKSVSRYAAKDHDDNDELMEVARVAVWHAANVFDPARGRWSTIASTCIDMRVRGRAHYLVTKRERRHRARFCVDSLDEPRLGTNLPRQIASPTPTPEQTAVGLDLYERFAPLLDQRHRDVLELRMLGHNIEEIARQRGCTRANVSLIMRGIAQKYQYWQHVCQSIGPVMGTGAHDGR
jgi:RNA polymerase sigma factor (sigma-70 family)